MFDGEFVKQMAALTEKRSAPMAMALPPRAGNVLKIWNPARGEFEDVRLSDVPHEINCGDAETLVAAHETNADTKIGPGGFWISHQGIMARFDSRPPKDCDSKGFAFLGLVPTAEFVALREGFDGNPLDVLRKVKELRDVFPTEFVEALKKFRFTTQSESQGSAGPGREALSRSVVKEASFGDAPVIETVKARFRVYENFQFDPAFKSGPESEIDMVVLYDYAECEIYIKPRSGELHRVLWDSHLFAKGALEGLIQARIEDAGGDTKLAPRVYIGSP